MMEQPRNAVDFQHYHNTNVNDITIINNYVKLHVFTSAGSNNSANAI